MTASAQPHLQLDERLCLPEDADVATMLGRVWLAGNPAGPCVVVIEDGRVYDLTAYAPTLSWLLNRKRPLEFVRQVPRDRCLGAVGELLQNSVEGEVNDSHYFLAPSDLQSIKACGVTFVDSLLERLVEEQASGDPGRANEIRADLLAVIGTDLSQIKPDSAEARTLKKTLQKQGRWS